MSSTNSSQEMEKKLGPFEHSRFYSVPDLKGGFDRFCHSCGFVMENAALEKLQSIDCPNCKANLHYNSELDGIFRPCVRCCSYIRCTFRFCYMCRAPNRYYDENCETRQLRALTQKIRVQVKQELEAKQEALDASLAFKKDSDLEPNGKNKKGEEQQKVQKDSYDYPIPNCI